MSAAPRISVVVPAYNLENVIAQTLASVFAQTSPPDEIIVVDDGSVDATAAVVASAADSKPGGNVRLVRQPHLGPGATRNRGIREASGDWIAFLDGDDIWLPAKIERLRDTIANRPGATMVAHDEYEVPLRGKEFHKALHCRYDAAKPLLPQLYRGCFFSTSCIAVRKAELLRVGGFDEDLGSSQDYDLWLKLARQNDVVFIDEPLEKYVIRENSISSRLLLRYRCLLQIAYRHAPYLIPIVGRTGAYLLRARFVVASHKAVLFQALQMRNFRDAMYVIARSLIEIPKAFLTNISAEPILNDRSSAAAS